MEGIMKLGNYLFLGAILLVEVSLYASTREQNVVVSQLSTSALNLITEDLIGVDGIIGQLGLENQPKYVVRNQDGGQNVYVFPHQIFGASDAEAAKTAYRRLSRIHHPDRGGSSQISSAINTAYERINDQEHPYRFDRTLNEFDQISRAATYWNDDVDRVNVLISRARQMISEDAAIRQNDTFTQYVNRIDGMIPRAQDVRNCRELHDELNSFIPLFEAFDRQRQEQRRQDTLRAEQQARLRAQQAAEALRLQQEQQREASLRWTRPKAEATRLQQEREQRARQEAARVQQERQRQNILRVQQQERERIEEQKREARVLEKKEEFVQQWKLGTQRDRNRVRLTFTICCIAAVLLGQQIYIKIQRDKKERENTEEVA
jgi:curved DNA-binding protein CbpA